MSGGHVLREIAEVLGVDVDTARGWAFGEEEERAVRVARDAREQ